MERRLDFDGSFNFRDLGGWRTGDGGAVRWRRVFRADSVHLMTELDARRAREDVGLRTLLDLRSDVEIAGGGIGLLAGAGLRRLHLPITDAVGGPRRAPSATPEGIDSPAEPVRPAAWSADRSPEAMSERYWGMMHATPQLIVAALEAIASEDAQPAVFFCSAGKDRTGVLAAALLGALGVRDEDIVADYELTTEAIERIILRFRESPGAAALYRDNPPEHFRPYAATMRMLLERTAGIYGSMQGYLSWAGVRDAVVDELRLQLVEPA